VGWKAVARSAIGTGHQKQGLPCQDYGGDRIFNNLLIGAVADGAGSAKYADLGAKLAVTTAIAHLASTEIWLRQRQRSWQKLQQPFSQRQAERLFVSTLKRVLYVLRQQADRGGYTISELACTLTAFMVTPYWLAAMQIGDGSIVVRSQYQKDYQLLFKPDKGQYFNQTTFVTSSNAFADLQVKVLAQQPKFICAATDGIERVAFRLQDWTVGQPFFKWLEQYMQETENPEREDECLLRLLESQELNRQTDDDKTLLVCLYN
jgi:hypothetical protein